MRGAVGGRQLLGGLVACEIATFAIVNVNVGDLAATVNDLTAVTHKRWQPPRWASDALFLLDAQYGTLRCGRVERRAASEAPLGRVVKLGVNLLKRVMRQQAQKDWDSRLDHGVKVKIQRRDVYEPGQSVRRPSARRETP